MEGASTSSHDLTPETSELDESVKGEIVNAFTYCKSLLKEHELEVDDPASDFAMVEEFYKSISQLLVEREIIDEELIIIGEDDEFNQYEKIIQAIYFTISLLNDFVGCNEIAPKKTPLIRKAKDYLLASLAFPVAMNVGISFWSLMIIDRELVFPEAFDEFFPSWLNHIMHTNIMVFILLELCVTFCVYPSRSKGLFGLTIFMISYLAWIHIIKYHSGVWVYPVLDVLNLPQRIAFFLLILFVTWSLYFFGEFLNGLIWSKELRQAFKKAN